MAFSDCHHSKSVNKEYGLEMEVITKKIDDYTFGKGKVASKFGSTIEELVKFSEHYLLNEKEKFLN